MPDALAGWTGILADRYQIDRATDGQPTVLGQGGMATVYQALDLKHHRKVAVKILRPNVAAVVGAERFLQEIEVTASLQHPHILPLHDSGILRVLPDGPALPFYVMPLVEGESLRQRLTRETQLPVDEALAIAKAVASALDYAHRRGVVHRDIKPENILLHEGQALVADFGIALAVATAGGSRLTETGIALGTPHYMSPEQAVGEREITPRSDVYSLGCVMYEMLAGEPPFTGPTAQAITAKALTDTPRALHLGRPVVSPVVEAAISRALAKLPADRFASAGAFVDAWELPGRAGDPPVQSAARVPASRSRAALWPIVAVAALGAAVWAWLRPVRPGDDQVVRRFEITLPPDIPARERIGARIALAPDGKSLVYIGITDGVRRLFVRFLDQTAARPLGGTEGASMPFYSPDSKWLAFVVGREMKKVPLAAGEPVTIAKVPAVISGATWGDLGVIVFTPFDDSALWQVPADGGTPTLVTHPDSSQAELAFMTPEFLPGGEAVMFSSVAEGSGEQVAVVVLPNGHPVRLLSGAYPRSDGKGRVVFLGAHGLEVVRVKSRRVETEGPGDRLAISPASRIYGSEFALSHEGTLIYITSQQREPRTVVLVDRRGTATPLGLPAGIIETPRLSPDGRLIAARVYQGDDGDVWVYGVAEPVSRRLTFTGGAGNPAWTPDGQTVSWTRGDDSIHLSRADGTGSPLGLRLQRRFLPSAWSPDGRWLVALENFVVGGDLWRIPIDTALEPLRLFQTPFLEYDPVVSPDGRWVAYTSNESGQWEVNVQAFPGPGGRFQVSLGGGLMPLWDRSGRELYYRSGNGLYSATVAPGPAFNITKRTLLFDAPALRSTEIERDYDVTPDGKHFVMLERADPLEKLVVVLNWPADLKTSK